MRLASGIIAPLLRTRFSRLEREWAEAIFAAILAPETVGLPAFEEIDRVAFWRCLEQAPGPLFGPGLRGMIHAVTMLPLADRRYLLPLFALPLDVRHTLVEELANDRRYAVRQMMSALKMVACFAYFDDPVVRARFAEPRPRP